MATSTMNIDLGEDAQILLRDYVKGRGTKQREVLARLLKWFTEQPPSVQSVVMGWVDAGMEQAYADALRLIADRLEKNKAGVVNHDDAGGVGAAPEPRRRAAARSIGRRLGQGPKEDQSTNKP